MKTYVKIQQANQYQRLGMFKEAHKIIIALEDTLKANLNEDNKVDKHTVLYLEWLLMAKKVFMKQMFQ